MKSMNKIKLTGMTVLFLMAGMGGIKSASACAAEPLLGSLCVFGGNFAPRGYAMAQGQLLPIAQNTALFSLLGTIYGGDGRTTFALPDARGRSLIGFGRGPGLSSYPIGARGGVESVKLTVNQMPSHTHTASTTLSGTGTVHASSNSGNSDQPTGNVWAVKSRDNIYSSTAPNVTMNAAAVTISGTGQTTVNNTGGSQAHENRSPFLAVNWLIATVGIFPSRN